MKLHSIRVQGFRKHLDTEVILDKNTFLIGMNNMGKSTIFKAIEYLLSDTKKVDDINDFLGLIDESNENYAITNEIVISGEFRDCPPDCHTWRGFKGRIFNYNPPEGSIESGLGFFYKKTFRKGQNVKVEIKENIKTINPKYIECKTKAELIENGFPNGILEELFENVDINKVLTAGQIKKLNEEEDYYLFEEGTEVWTENPGGIPGNVLSRLPNFLLIPAQDKTDEISSDKGTLVKTLVSLFNDVRESSENFVQAQKYLSLLEKELDPNDEEKEFGKMMKDLNGVLGEVFPDISLKALANLSDANKTIRPIFDISMSSNYNTPVENQGTGAIRSAVFAMLRYRDMKENASNNKSLIIGFEEPELYLHPNAAYQLRETIYSLAASNNNQIICTTHSPYMIDLTKSENQILNHLTSRKEKLESEGNIITVEKIYANAFNVSQAYRTLTSDDKTFVKMVLKLDDYMSKVFFTPKVLIVEGDTEDVVIRETIKRMPEKVKIDVMQNWSIVKARGKATIISLVKYFNAMGIYPHVIHDMDSGVSGAEKFNKPISEVVNNEKLFVLENCVEDILGYQAPTSEKPYTAYKFINDNWEMDWESIGKDWRELSEKVFSSSFIKYQIAQKI